MIPSSLLALLPEIWVSGLAFLILALDLKWKDRKPASLSFAAAIGILPVLGILLWQIDSIGQEGFQGMYRIDAISLFLKGIFVEP